jgi:hypothetical protein
MVVGDCTANLQQMPVCEDKQRRDFPFRRHARIPRVLVYPEVNNKPDPEPEGSSEPTTDSAQPSLYLINPTSLAKPHAIEHFGADLRSYNPDLAIVVESWFKQKHTDASMGIEGYSLYCRDREDRRGGGVAIYCKSHLHSQFSN